MKLKERLLATGSVLIGAALGGIIYEGLEAPMERQQAEIQSLEDKLSAHEKADSIIHGAQFEDSAWQTGLDCAFMGALGAPVGDCRDAVQEQLEYWRKILRDAIKGKEPEPPKAPGISS